MVEAHEVARAWGFKPKTIITWVKHKKNDPESPSMKTGYYFRSATEHCLFAVRGSLRLQVSEGIPTWFYHPRLPHSVKPDLFRELITRVSYPEYLELFARKAYAGWNVWGNQVPATATAATCDDA
jgi:N6-adenosine-specific RNA methylase IME4